MFSHHTRQDARCTRPRARVHTCPRPPTASSRRSFPSRCPASRLRQQPPQASLVRATPRNAARCRQTGHAPRGPRRTRSRASRLPLASDHRGDMQRCQAGCRPARRIRPVLDQQGDQLGSAVCNGHNGAGSVPLSTVSSGPAGDAPPASLQLVCGLCGPRRHEY